MNFENEATYHDGVSASVILHGPDSRNGYTITAKQQRHGQKDKQISMYFSHDGLAALVGCWRAALGEFADAKVTAMAQAECPYCHPTEAGKYRGANIGEPQGLGRPYQLHLVGRMLAVTDLDGGTWGFAVHYCPICGRNLEVEK